MYLAHTSVLCVWRRYTQILECLIDLITFKPVFPKDSSPSNALPTLSLLYANYDCDVGSSDVATSLLLALSLTAKSSTAPRAMRILATTALVNGIESLRDGSDGTAYKPNTEASVVAKTR